MMELLEHTNLRFLGSMVKTLKLFRRNSNLKSELSDEGNVSDINNFYRSEKIEYVSN
jgi:hypothetical protein